MNHIASRHSGRGPLTWAQKKWMWREYLGRTPGRPGAGTLVRGCKIPDGVTLEVIGDAVRWLVARHEILRSTFGVAGTAEPEQVVHPPRNLKLDVRAVPTDSDLWSATVETAHALRHSMFDLTDDGPIAVTVLTVGGHPRVLLLAVHHIAVDAWAVTILREEFEMAGLASMAPLEAVAPVLTSGAPVTGTA